MLDREARVQMLEALAQSNDFKPGDRVQNLWGLLRGVMVRLLEDGRVVRQPDGPERELTGLPERLCPEGPTGG